MICRSAAILSFVAAIAISVPALAQDDGSTPIELVVETGRPLRIALDDRVNVKHVGQPVTGTLIDQVYAYDRVVVPAGTKVRGHVTVVEPPTKTARVQAFANGDFSPHNRVVIGFDALLLNDGREIPIRTAVTLAAEHLTLSAAGQDDKDKDEDGDGGGIADETKQAVAQARHDAMQKARSALNAIKSPGRSDRLKAAMVAKLPYHPQYLPKGSVYDADLVEPLDFGAAAPATAAGSGSLPAPNSVLTARLATPLDSSKNKRGDKVEAIVIEPVFAADHRLVLPEGSRLVGEVTVVRNARHWHRNGQLRFLLESVQPPQQDAMRMLASLYSVQAGDADSLAIDDEGGARTTSSKTRFIAPALAIMALRASTHHEHRRFDNDGDDSLPGPTGSPLSRGVGGFFGWSVAGAIVSQFYHPVGIAFAALGAARTTYSAVIAKGRDVTFPADTVIQVQLAPGAAAPR